MFSGAYTAYRISDNIVIEGKKYKSHGISSVYFLFEPEDRKDNWRVEFYNPPYINWINEILNGGARQYFIEDRKAIEDRHTTQRPYLYLFYRQLIKRKKTHNLLTRVLSASMHNLKYF